METVESGQKEKKEMKERGTTGEARFEYQRAG